MLKPDGQVVSDTPPLPHHSNHVLLSTDSLTDASTEKVPVSDNGKGKIRTDQSDLKEDEVAALEFTSVFLRLESQL